MVNGERVASRAVDRDFDDDKIQWTHGDVRGSVKFETDHEGKVLSRTAYFPSGELWYAGASAIRGPPEFRFQGKERERSTGLYAFGKRHDHPRDGIWLSPDPALADYFTSSLAGGMENPRNLGLYSYTWNNPLRFVDPDGRFTSDRWSWAPSANRTPEDVYSELRRVANESPVMGWAAHLIRLGVASVDTEGGKEEMRHAAKALVQEAAVELLTGVAGKVLKTFSNGRRVTKAIDQLSPSEAANAALVQRIATAAERRIGGSGARAGTLKHSYAQKLLERYQGIFGDRGLEPEFSFRRGLEIRYGFPGSVRFDVFDVAARIGYDYKFTLRSPNMRMRQFLRGKRHGIRGIRIFEVNP